MCSMFGAVLFVAAIVGPFCYASPSRCMSCFANTWDDCDKKDDSDSCRSGESSYCYSAFVTYNTAAEKGLTRVNRGCMADICTDKSKACDFIATKLSGKSPQVNLTQCEVDCCTTDNCNADTRPNMPNKSNFNSPSGVAAIVTLVLSLLRNF